MSSLGDIEILSKLSFVVVLILMMLLKYGACAWLWNMDVSTLQKHVLLLELSTLYRGLCFSWRCLHCTGALNASRGVYTLEACTAPGLSIPQRFELHLDFSTVQAFAAPNPEDVYSSEACAAPVGVYSSEALSTSGHVNTTESCAARGRSCSKWT
jgi:hypothetical protein